ncbi:carbamate kinase [Candidatus Woesearchaeota archaeon CG11_big_fil_rev_8_21_14_0_20_43_8]|nr:MAG: carbamate kinase [Candidatus Woesearchaeota archaeon CG11_big_fil_rev_8_21_14_0_20_43_8]PIO06761.1 MAG: carbamate kinase [Candidatus Woesearchaeota archaeon CG08_land_8_20_14_0_20_43_7]
MKTYVVALGGNAILKKGEEGNIKQQFANTRASLDGVVKLLRDGCRLVITHGNGPVVGNILIRVEEGSKKGIPRMPLGICVADSQGGIGYMLQQCLQNRLIDEKIEKCVATVITQVLVDKDDPCVSDPTKPVGPFYKDDELERIRHENPLWVLKEDAGRGHRRVVPSPFPLDIIEKRSIKKILEDGFVVIAAGGGGIPVYLDENGKYEGFDAVIDKDLASYVLGREIKADSLVIVTGVDGVYKDFGTDKQELIREMSVDEMMGLHDKEYFPKGSMAPKVQAACMFVESGGKEAIITSIERFNDALDGKSGTRIIKMR